MDRVREPLPTRVADTPDLPAAYHAAVNAGLAALGLTLAPAARFAIDGHIRLLLRWTSAINLTAVRDPVAAATTHVLDSLSAVPLLRSWGTDRFMDLGSGGGLPGIPLAAALPAAGLLVDSVGKKGRFLETVAAAVGLENRVTVAVTRAEALGRDPDHRGRWPVVTARAVAPLADLVEVALPLLVEGGRLVAWKRGDLGDELRGAESPIRALGGASIDVSDVAIPGLIGHRLVTVTRLGRVPDGYPRDRVRRRRDLP
ncbi:MAG: 16S rRNA (guanine(527)-N(7))-methyltransferase RsmG [Chloroflexota bacterium]|nr:16S rRNA (guanine(527)-N(7))-methyltransferase RsmG [Chloroflexota bacterium]